MSIVPKGWMPQSKMDRIICHWTAGSYKASSLDRQHYHILIEANGDLVRGFHEVSDNENTSDGDYAAHVKGINTRSIGISVCCMAGADDSPFSAGQFPMTQTQWLKMAAVAADLAQSYGIAVAPQTVLGHGEVQAILGKPQNGKWDPMVLPWKPGLTKDEVGKLFRTTVQGFMTKAGIAPVLVAGGEGLPVATALINGTALAKAIFSNEDVLFSTVELAAAPGWTVTTGNNGMVSASVGGRSIALATDHLTLDGGAAETFVSAREIAFALDAKLSFDPERNVVGLNWA